MNDIPRPWTDPELARSLQKPRPKLLEKRDRAAKADKADREEREQVKARSGGRCEVLERWWWGDFWSFRRCDRHASENHHLIGGIGRRNKGKSILAAHRLHVCDKCHTEITNKVLIPVDGTKKDDAATVRYERVK